MTPEERRRIEEFNRRTGSRLSSDRRNANLIGWTVPVPADPLGGNSIDQLVRLENNDVYVPGVGIYDEDSVPDIIKRQRHKMRLGNLNEVLPMPNNRRQVTPYVQGRKSYDENLLTREMHPTDGNMMGFEQMYGEARPDTSSLQRMPIDQTVKRFRELYGDEQAIMVLDELVRMQEEAGPSHSQGGPKAPTEIESYGRARRNPTDANLMGHEARYGYPPSVAAQPSIQQTPFGRRPPQGPLNAFALKSRPR